MHGVSAVPERMGVFYGWRVVGACFALLFLFAGAGFYSFSIFIRPLEESMGWSRAAISLTMSIYFMVSGLVGPLVGRWVQSRGPKRVMMVSAVASGAFFMAASLTRSLGYFYAVYGLLAMANCGVGIIPVSTILSQWFDRRRGTAIGLAMVGISAGGFVLTPVVGLINERFGWQASFLFLGLLVWAVALPVVWFVIRGTPMELGLAPDGREPESPALPSSGRGLAPAALRGWKLRAALRTRAFWGVSGAFFLAPMAMMGVLQHQVPLLVESGLSQSAAALAMGVTAGMGGLGKVGFGRIAEFVPFRYVATLCFALQAVGVLIVLGGPPPALIWAYVLLFGFSMGGVIVLIPLSVGHFFGLASFGVILGAVMLAQAVGNSVGAYASGLIHDLFGSYDYALTLFFGVYLAAIAAIWSAGRPRDPHNEQRA